MWPFKWNRLRNPDLSKSRMENRISRLEDAFLELSERLVEQGIGRRYTQSRENLGCRLGDVAETYAKGGIRQPCHVGSIQKMITLNNVADAVQRLLEQHELEYRPPHTEPGRLSPPLKRHRGI
jgi:hypothetical protein